MNALNFEVISITCEWLEQGDRVFYVTVLNTWGAAPRPVGSLFAYNLDKHKQVGSLSGGCIEDDLVIFLKEFINVSSDDFKCVGALPGKNSTNYLLKKYGDSEGDGERYLLPCGGVLELLIEPLCQDLQYKHFANIKTQLALHRPIARRVQFNSPHNSYLVQCEESVDQQNKVLEFEKKKEAFYHRLDPIYQLLIIGVGDVTSYVADLAEVMDFRVTICEPRKSYASRLQTHHKNAQVEYCLPDDLIRSDFKNSNNAIICLAHDPKVDDMALVEALKNSKAFYIGAMGSIRTTANRLERLRALGLNNQQIKRLHAPIGVDIHSKTPQEIAIAILAELISYRYKHMHSV